MKPLYLGGILVERKSRRLIRGEFTMVIGKL
jgi:hypothetical protein